MANLQIVRKTGSHGQVQRVDRIKTSSVVAGEQTDPHHVCEKPHVIAGVDLHGRNAVSSQATRAHSRTTDIMMRKATGWGLGCEASTVMVRAHLVEEHPELARNFLRATDAFSQERDDVLLRDASVEAHDPVFETG